MRRESFEHFYLTKIALAEGCGCAEHVTRMREVEDHTTRHRLGDTSDIYSLRPFRMLIRLWQMFSRATRKES